MVETHEFVIAANRLPVRQTDDGWVLSPGGLVTALIPVMKNRSSSWIGWSGEPGVELAPFEHDGLDLDPVTLDQDDFDDYYEGFSNGTIWPLYHSGALSTQYHRHWWEAYRRVNRRFAERAMATTAENGTLWVHDYHLQLVPQLVRDGRPDLRTGFFLHTPFPPAELFQRLPWREQIARGLLGADIVGFQTPDDAQDFLSVCRRMLDTPGTFLDDGQATLEWEGREVTVGAFPISIDMHEIERKAVDPETIAAAADLWVQVGSPKTLLLGVDRLDYTKGIDVRLRALHELLIDGAVDAADVAFIQVATPSRDDVRGYAETRDQVERLVSEINGDFASMGVPVVHYLHQSFSFDELLTMYVAADVMLVTPFRDGMNLVAKEFVAAKLSGRGTLVLSEFAGTAQELTDAFLCNPFDLDGVKRVLLAAMNAPVEEQERRMRAMRERLTNHTVHDWAGKFLRELR
ncbi:MAG: trehalose-6-phosphate synthase [Actinomycetia bacterium]|nr:trehalose-6-phosphate synthase [Actinomycetes bacterium]MCP4958708.1 trehalose-6-phosphate synthase [Actinomycetes bacterium]